MFTFRGVLILAEATHTTLAADILTTKVFSFTFCKNTTLFVFRSSLQRTTTARFVVDIPSNRSTPKRGHRMRTIKNPGLWNARVRVSSLRPVVAR